jgi:hypothetical protein
MFRVKKMKAVRTIETSGITCTERSCHPRRFKSSRIDVFACLVEIYSGVLYPVLVQDVPLRKVSTTCRLVLGMNGTLPPLHLYAFVTQREVLKAQWIHWKDLHI